MLAGHILLASVNAIKKLYRTLNPHRIGVYGPSLTGKTTLDQYLTVPGDIEPIPLEFRTSHIKTNGSYQLPQAHRHQIKWKKERHPVSSADIGGQDQFRSLWVEDMFLRQPNIIFFMVDDRAVKSPQFVMESVASLQYLVNNITRLDTPTHLSRKAKKNRKNGYKPELICLLINKMDLWWTPQAQYLWNNGLQREHPIVQPYRQELRKLRKAGIQADIAAISAQHGLNVEKTLINLIEAL